VDSFVTGGDEGRCREIAAGIAQADYDGLIFTHGDVGFSWDILNPIADNGIRIVTFEALPYRDGKSIKGLIATFQNDYHLARLSLDTLLAHCSGEGEHPAKIIRVGCDPGIIFLDRRAWEFDQLVGMGKIEETALVRLAGLMNPQSAAWEATAAILPYFPPGSVDAVWAPWDEFAAGCAEALAAAGRQDIKLFSVGISNDTMRLMLRHRYNWLATTTTDLRLAGTINMRLLAAKLAGETVNNTFLFGPQVVRTADLHYAVNMANISALMPGWEDGLELFDHFQWMDDLKAAEGMFLRISPTVHTVAP
jgi:simple sugar transport system substrate-binding protein